MPTVGPVETSNEVIRFIMLDGDEVTRQDEQAGEDTLQGMHDVHPETVVTQDASLEAGERRLEVRELHPFSRFVLL